MNRMTEKLIPIPPHIRIYLIAVFCILVVTFSIKGASANAKDADYDRLRAIERFLDVVYPQLHEEKGLLTLQSDEFNSHTGTLYLFLTQCAVGSGVPGGGEKTPFPNCGGLVGFAANSEFLRPTIEPGTARFPIRRFYAEGGFVQEKRNLVLADMKVHPNWKEAEMLDALVRAKPKFGPDNTTAFLKSVPAAAIYEFSGCRLDLGGATFSIGSDTWDIRGTYRQPKGKYPCSAKFEPFEGKLVGIDEL